MSTVGRAAHRCRAHLLLAALAAGLLASPGRWEWAVVAAAAALVLLALADAAGLALAAAALLIAGSLAGDARLAAIDRGSARLGAAGLDRGVPVPIAGRAHLLEPPRRSRFGWSATIRLADGPLAGVRLYARAPGAAGRPARLRAGAEARVLGLARPPGAPGRRLGSRGPPTAGGGRFDFAAHLRRRGIAGELAATRIDATGRARGGLAGAVDRARGRAERALTRGLRPREAALARGLVLGEDEQIDELVRQDFRDAGLGHLLAVSGQNVMLLCALALPLLALAGLGRRARVAVLLALIAAYVPLAGAGPSLQRAAVMGAAGLVAAVAGRPASRWYALLLAAAATLALNPRVSGDPGWQLSFAAVAGIVALAGGFARALLGALAAGRRARRGRAVRPGRLARALTEGVAITTAATVATVPLLGLHFGAVPLASLPANLAALPAVAPIMWIGMLQAALGQLGAVAGVGAVAGAAARALAAPDALLLRYLAGVAERAAAAGAALPLGLSPAGAVLAYLLLVAAAVLVRRLVARSGPRAVSRLAAWSALPAAARGATGAAAVVAALLAATLSPGARAVLPGRLGSAGPPAAFTVSFLDVGQGDATLVQDGAGASVLFDGGPPEARVYRELRAAGVARLDLVVSTHQSRDHQGGLHEVLARIPTRLLLENGYGTADPDYHRLLAEADARGVRRLPASAGQVLRVGRLTVEVLGPRPRAPGEPAPEEPNPIGVAAIVSCGSFELWLSADAESDAVLPLPLRPVEAMKVSHHGSRDAGLPELLSRLEPEVAAIEVGAGNAYGHPAPSTLAALRARVPHVYATDRDGTVRLTVEGGRMRVSTER